MDPRDPNSPPPETPPEAPSEMPPPADMAPTPEPAMPAGDAMAEAQSTTPTTAPMAPIAPMASAPPTAPPVAWGPAQAPTAITRGRVTGLAKIAAVILIVLGTIVTLAGVLVLAGGAFIGTASSQTELPYLAGAVGGILAFFGIVIAGIGIIEVLAGIGAWRGSGAGRITGIVLSVLFVLFGLLGLGNSGDNSSPLFSLLIVLLYGFVAAALAFRWKTAT
jgi:hypothetical protein